MRADGGGVFDGAEVSGGISRASVGGDATWSTRKTLDRMAEKGLVTIEAVHGVKTFAAAKPKLETLAGLIADFTRNVLGASEPIPAATFVNSTLIDEDEIAELEALLERLSKEGDGNAP